MQMTVAEEARDSIPIRVGGEADSSGKISDTTPAIPVTGGKIKIKKGVLTSKKPNTGSAIHKLELQVQYPNTVVPPLSGPGYGTVVFKDGFTQPVDINIEEIEIGRFQISVIIDGFQEGEKASVRFELYTT
jgi:hypothetical protein